MIAATLTPGWGFVLTLTTGIGIGLLAGAWLASDEVSHLNARITRLRDALTVIRDHGDMTSSDSARIALRLDGRKQRTR